MSAVIIPFPPRRAPEQAPERQSFVAEIEELRRQWAALRRPPPPISWREEARARFREGRRTKPNPDGAPAA